MQVLEPVLTREVHYLNYDRKEYITKCIYDDLKITTVESCTQTSNGIYKVTLLVEETESKYIDSILADWYREDQSNNNTSRPEFSSYGLVIIGIIVATIIFVSTVLNLN